MKRIFLSSLLIVCYSALWSQDLKFINVSTTHLPASVLGNHNSMDIRIGDIDQDGDPDMVLAIEFFKNVILINDGTGKFTDGSDRLPDKVATENPPPWRYYPYHDSEDVALADFDNDGDLDIVIVTEDDEINEYYLNDGKGYFTDVSASFPVTGVSNAVIAGDFDGDGWVDLIIGNNGQNNYLRNKEGTLIDETSGRLPQLEDITQDVEAYDIDRDGDLDLVIGNEKENLLLENDGKGVFRDITKKLLDPAYLENGETREADFADINGDGHIDLYFANANLFQGMPPVQRMLIWDPTTNRFKDETALRLGFTKDHSVIDADFADVDLDGDLDLLFQTLERPRIYLNDGQGFFTDETNQLLPGLTGMGIDVECYDFSGDGKPDLYFGNFRTGDFYFIQE